MTWSDCAFQSVVFTTTDEWMTLVKSLDRATHRLLVKLAIANKDERDRQPGDNLTHAEVEAMIDREQKTLPQAIEQRTPGTKAHHNLKLNTISAPLTAKTIPISFQNGIPELNMPPRTLAKPQETPPVSANTPASENEIVWSSRV